MLVRKLQNLGLLIILLFVINTSSHPYPIQEESYRTYPIHRVALNPRGYHAINNICIHWYDYLQQEKSTDCDIPFPQSPIQVPSSPMPPNKPIQSSSSKTSPDWSIGYKLSIHTEAGTFHEGPFLWWDGWFTINVSGNNKSDDYFWRNSTKLVVFALVIYARNREGIFLIK
ncbi:18243_t:CDS:2 [Funneliformis geosporum]|uniref:17445_t:CDS:1 n=1 Tax=Funneliformis geosporum TaxID=1117311 RepID=A0A9W4X307_9GLOM|nr:17445_t:CDS:2 [Funneliformis geosporum]CAI2183147.1 18243_t:CDS:2 [Funneliformis geosporum]